MGGFNSLPKWFLGTKAGEEAVAEATARHLSEREQVFTRGVETRDEFADKLEVSGKALAAAQAADREAAERHQ